MEKIPSTYRQGLSIYHNDSASGLTVWGEGMSYTPGENGAVIDVGDFYGAGYVKNIIAKVNIDISRFLPTDTLYVGISQTNYTRLYPVPTLSILTFSAHWGGPVLSDNNKQRVTWGIGKNQYWHMWSLFEDVEEVKPYLFFAPAANCKQPDTAEFYIK